MALIIPTLQNQILNALKNAQKATSPAQGNQILAAELAKAIDMYIRSGDVTTAVATDVTTVVGTTVAFPIPVVGASVAGVVTAATAGPGVGAGAGKGAGTGVGIGKIT